MLPKLETVSAASIRVMSRWAWRLDMRRFCRAPGAPYPTIARSPMNPGLLYTALAFVSWGLFPLYFRVIAHVAPLEVVLHRSVWTLSLIHI